MTTPTSATGSSTEHGFTLVELLVVITIVGLIGAAVMLAIPDPRGSLREEGERFAARLVAARDAAIIGGRDTSVRVDARGYAFEQRLPDGWTPVAARGFEQRVWTSGTAIGTYPAGLRRISFDVTGLATPASMSLQRDGYRLRVRVDVSGEVHVDAG